MSTRSIKSMNSTAMWLLLVAIVLAFAYGAWWLLAR